MSTAIETFEEESNKAEQQKILYNQLYSELCNNKKISDYYKGYDPGSLDSFLKEYTAEKLRILEWAPSFIKWQDKEDLQHSEQAFECLKQIQQKKLFDLQCQWRAELITIPGIIVGEQFIDEGNNILNCKMVSPVSEEDLDLYLQFMGNEEYYQHSSNMPSMLWQMYWAIKMVYEGKEIPFFGFPVWYYYHNLMTGNSKYLLLPNIKGEKEEYYLQLSKGEIKENAAKPIIEESVVIPGSIHAEDVAKATPQPKRTLDYYREGFITRFVRNMEDKEVQKEFRNAGGEKLEKDMNDYGEMDVIVRALSSYGEVLPIERSHNWKDALRATLNKHKYDKLKEAIFPAYEEYNMYISNNFEFASDKDNPILKSKSNQVMKEILQGRKIAGEPEDFNF